MTLENCFTENRIKLFNEVLKNRTKFITVVLEDIYQPQNASAILRTCEYFGIQDVHIIEKNNKFTISKAVVQGADKWLHIHYYKNGEKDVDDCIGNLKKKEYLIVATTLDKSALTLSNFDINNKCAIFFGNEGEGLSDEVKKGADINLKIPSIGFTPSLNVSVAAGIIIYQVCQKMKINEGLNWQLSKEKYNDIKSEWMKKRLGCR